MGVMSSSRAPLRLLRGATAASVATGVALAGHVLGGGAMPGFLGIALPWWLSVTLCTVLAGSRFTLARMGGAVLASQALFHGLFLAGTPSGTGVVLRDPPGEHLNHHAGAHAATGTGDALTAHAAHGADGVGTAAAHALHGSGGDLQMLLGHVIAALLTTVVLQHGEDVLARCARLVLAVLDVLAAPPQALVAPRFVLPRPARPVPAITHLHHAQRALIAPQLRRGPPVLPTV